MKNIIVAKNKEHLQKLIAREIKQNGYECDLNHINVSAVTDMSYLFIFDIDQFNGDISQWDVSNVTDMSYMFSRVKFNGDISNWNVAKVKSMENMFHGAKFNGDISKWDVSNVVNMDCIFRVSSFNGDLSNWSPLKLGFCGSVFFESKVPVPYWAKIDDVEERTNAINKYQLANELNQELSAGTNSKRKMKI